MPKDTAPFRIAPAPPRLRVCPVSRLTRGVATSLPAAAALLLVGCMSARPEVVNVNPSYSYRSSAAAAASDASALNAPKPWPVLSDQQAYIDGVAETLALDVPVFSNQ